MTTTTFHPERPNTFLLAFADGSCATYDAARLFHEGGRGERRIGPASSGAKTETMFIKNVHATNNIVAGSALEETQGYDTSTGVAVIGNKCLGITAAAFVPGYKSKFVTVGQDGKCCVIDLAVPGKREARIVNSWHVRSPATSLSITPFNQDHGIFGNNNIEATKDADHALKGNPLIAIGCHDGRVLLFDLRGNQLGGETFHPDGSRVVDVEWMSGQDPTGRKSSRSGHGMPQTPPAKGKRKRVGSVLGRGRAGTEEIISVLDGTDEMVLVPARDSSVRENTAEEPKVQRDLVATVLNHMDLFSPIKVLSETKAAKIKMSREHERDSEDSEATIKAVRSPVSGFANDALTDTHTKYFDEEHHPKPSIKRDLVPPIPERPAPGKGKDSLASRAETVPEPKNGQNTTVEVSRHSRGLGLFAPYMKPNIIAVPANSGDPRNKSSGNKANAQNAASPKATDEDLWTDIAPEPRQPTHTAPRKPFKRSTSQIKSVAFRPPSSGPSEASNETVIDWAAASSRPPNPLLPHPPFRPYTNKIFKKGHISLSRSSTSHDTMVQWSSFKKKPGFNIHNDLPDSIGQLSSSHPSPTNIQELPATQPLTVATHNPKVKPKPLFSQRRNPSQAAPPPAPAFLFQAELATPQAHHDGSLQQTDKKRSPRAEESPSPPPQAGRPRSMTLFSSILQRELQALRADLREDLARQLAVQQSWFEAQLAASWDERLALKEENRMLRGRLVIERRTRGAGGGSRGGRGGRERTA